MKTISSNFETHLAGEVTTLATCWKLSLSNGTVFGFTDYDKDMVISGLTYKASSGFTPTAVSSTSSLSVDNLDVEGF